MKYLCGQDIPANVVAALQFIARSGFITRNLWNNHFSSGNERWNRRQLRLLCERRILDLHSNPIAEECYVLGCFGRILLAKYGIAFVHSPYVSQISHDEALAHAILSLGKEGILRDWHLENEMKVTQMKQHQLNRSSKDQKYPDAIIKIRALNRERICAIEYERTRKSASRYRDILWLYDRMDSLWMVVFVCETDVIATSIKKQLKFLKQPVLKARVGFAVGESWLKNPSKTPIELDESVFTLGELCSTNEVKVA